MLKKILKIICVFILGLTIGIIINIPSCNTQESSIKYINVHDTITIFKDSIIYKTKPVNVYFHDTLYINKEGDTIKLDNLPITEYEYNDTIKTDSASTEIKINYHGFDAGIDNIHLVHNYLEKQETIIQPPKRVGWVWFIGVGPAVDIHYDIPTKTLGYGPAFVLTAGVGIGGTIK